MTDEIVVICPKCGSTEIEKRDHEQLLQKAGGVLLSSAGAAAGTVGGAASGASVGAAIGTVAGPLGVIMGATIGTFVGAISIGVTGGFLGHRFGKKAGVVVDQNIYLDYQCKKCKHRFKATTDTHINAQSVQIDHDSEK
ncbi:hypothetical protein [Acinetobacter sp. CFCC 10889]|uniref:hypothetical protein n=1 Tax=Acinetobacter sp. CFCC 10889 TaxID=1775557 RepID=UPI001D18588E|nr:hypothetical protein [Acinetobacter sp. CFCC 10889]